ncbi:MAG: fibronectin type III domain-containing protein [candidate division NC10 bacterium]
MTDVEANESPDSFFERAGGRRAGEELTQSRRGRLPVRGKHVTSARSFLRVIQVFVAFLFFAFFLSSPSWGAVTITHGPRLGLVTSTEATIYWDTDESAAGQVDWGASESYGFTKSESEASKTHRLTITGLSLATTYHYRVVTGSASSPDYTISTAVSPETEFTFASMADNRG